MLATGPVLKKLWATRSTTQAASIESVSLRRLMIGVSRGPLWRGARLEAIGPIGKGPVLTFSFISYNVTTMVTNQSKRYLFPDSFTFRLCAYVECMGSVMVKINHNM